MEFRLGGSGSGGSQFLPEVYVEQGRMEGRERQDWCEYAWGVGRGLRESISWGG